VTSRTGQTSNRQGVQELACKPEVVTSGLAPRRRLLGAIVPAALVLAGCSAESTAAWCTDASELVQTVNHQRDLSELPASNELRVDITGAVAVAGDVVSGAEADFVDAFRTIEEAIVGFDNTLAKYGYDLLRAQSESDSVEQESLYSLEASAIDDALANAQDHIDDRCALPAQ